MRTTKGSAHSRETATVTSNPFFLKASSQNSSICRACVGYCGAGFVSAEDNEQSRRALRFGAVLYGAPLLAVLGTLFLLATSQQMAPIVEAAALLSAAAIGYVGATLYLRRHCKIQRVYADEFSMSPQTIARTQTTIQGANPMHRSKRA